MTSTSSPVSAGLGWLTFAALTVVCWGLYGVFLHSGQAAMNDPVNGRYKAFLWVGLAYFLTAVLAPLALLWARGATWDYPLKGIGWSLVAGILGAAGALGVLLAFGAKGTPAVVMSIVFAGAPVVNAIYSLLQHPPAGGWSKLPLPFVLGIMLAAAGGCLVTLYKPAPPPARPAADSAHAATTPPQTRSGGTAQR
jgi:drug/metabolite transporter (DMT)-like permease